MHNRAEPFIHALETLLVKQVELHSSLLDLLKQKHESVREGNPKRMNDICALEQERIEHISTLEKHRVDLSSKIASILCPEQTQPLRVNDIAQMVGGDSSQRLLVLRVKLLDKMKQVRDQSAITQRATESLMKHMTGIVQNITAVSTGTPLYSQKGVVNPQGMRVSTLNMTA